MLKLFLISSFIIVLVLIGGEARKYPVKRQIQSGCPNNGGCSCICNCNSNGNCPPCPTMMPTQFPPTMGPNGTTPPPGQTTTPGGNFADTCFQLIRAAANLSAGQLIGLLLTTLLQNLVMPILQILLTGNNTVEGAVIPLANILCYILGIVLLLLRSLGLLGLLGFGGLLQNILGGIGGGSGGLGGLGGLG